MSTPNHNRDDGAAARKRPATTVEQVLAYSAAILAVLAFVAMITLLLAPLFGVDFAVGPTVLWSVVMAVAYYGFPLAFACLVALLITHVLLNRRATAPSASLPADHIRG